MPTMSSSLVKPAETPWTALAASARVRPCSAACSSDARLTSSFPSACWMLMPGGIGTVSLPFGPVTSNCEPIWTFTPPGSGIGFFPIRDIDQNLLPDAAENLAAHVLLVRVAPGHDAARRGQNVDTEPAQHARNLGLPDIDAATRPRDALDGRNHRRVVVAILQINLDGFLGPFFGDLEVGDVAFFFQNARDFRLELGSGHIHLGVPGLDRVAHARQHVGNGIGMHDSSASPPTSWP